MREYITIKEAEPREDYTLFVTFSNGKAGIFDVKPYLNKGSVFKAINNPVMFSGVRIEGGTVMWANDADLCPDCVYLETKFI